MKILRWKKHGTDWGDLVWKDHHPCPTDSPYTGDPISSASPFAYSKWWHLFWASVWNSWTIIHFSLPKVPPAISFILDSNTDSQLSMKFFVWPAFPLLWMMSAWSTVCPSSITAELVSWSAHSSPLTPAWLGTQINVIQWICDISKDLSHWCLRKSSWIFFSMLFELLQLHVCRQSYDLNQLKVAGPS